MQVESTAGFTPRKFGKFLLLERIGRGGMAEVFRAKTYGPAGFVKECAIKKILASLLDDEQFVHMFVDEAKVTAFLTHANIVQVLELGDIDGHLFISMEYISGKDLLDVLARSARRGLRIPQEVVISIAIEMLRGLAFAHQAVDDKGRPLRIVHRDVSPSNILVSYDGRVKVGDFGIAKSGVQTSHTEIGTQKGKTGYMSPEQVTGSSIDARSDLFAATVIVYEMLTMTRLFKAPNDLDVMLKIRDSDVEEDLSRASHLAPELAGVLRKGLAKEPEDRFQSADEFLRALEDVCPGLGIRPSTQCVANFIQDLFADKLASELAVRRADPSTDAGFSDVAERKGPRFRYRDPDGVIHGPMNLDMLEELLGSRVANALERVSIDGGEWSEVAERPEVSGISRPGAAAPAHESIEHIDPALEARQSGKTYDWEDLSLAGINPQRRKKSDEVGGRKKRKNKSVSTGEYRLSRLDVREDELTDRVDPAALTRAGLPRPVPSASVEPIDEPSGSGATYRVRSRAPASVSGSFVAVASSPRIRKVHFTPAQVLSVRQRVAEDAGPPQLEGATGGVSVLRIVHRVLGAERSGRLRLEARDAQRDLYFLDGRCVAIDSTLHRDQLGHLLVAREVLSVAQVDEALEYAGKGRLPLGDALVSLRMVAPHELFHYLQEQLREKLADSLFWTEVIWAWWGDDAFPTDTFPLAIDEMDTIVRSVFERGRTAYFKDFYEASLDRRLLRRDANFDPSNYALSAKALRLAAYLDEGLTVREVVDRFTHRYRWRTKEVFQTLFLLTEFEVFTIEGLAPGTLP